jgi:Ras GTPase-activating-like protein IQGAP2/3
MSIATGKKNLSQVCKVLGQITSGLEFGDDEPSYVPINDFVRNATQQMSAWFFEGILHASLLFLISRKLSVANLPDAETHFHAHEFMDATVQPKPIYISLNEIYNIHSMLVQHQSHLVCSHFLNCYSLLTRV